MTPQPEKPSRIASRIRGCLLGGAIGDALGAAVEFDSLDRIRRAHGPAGVTEYVSAYGRTGAITDDTQMTLFTAEGLLRAHVQSTLTGTCDPPSVVHNAYLRWLATQGEKVRAEIAAGEHWPDGWLVTERGLWSQRAPGTTCLGALRAAVKLGDLAGNDSKGCGTVMRVAPIGLAMRARDEAEVSAVHDLGARTSRLTHGHPAGFLAGGAFAVLIALLMEGRGLEAAVREMEVVLGRAPGADDVTQALAKMHRLLDRDGDATAERVEELGGGWVAEQALAIAIYCSLKARSFEHAVFLAVNHSGDSDSTGSLVGQILGAMKGEAVIPARWVDGLELREVIERIADDLARLRNGTFDVESEQRRYPGS